MRKKELKKDLCSNTKNAWVFSYDGFEPEKEDLREALCTLGNGYFATRGAAADASAGPIHYPGTYLAGGYNRLVSTISGREIENEDLVNFPNWLHLTFRIDDDSWFDLKNVKILSYHQELDIRKGMLLRKVRFRDKQGRETTMKNKRIVHMGFPHVAALETTIIAENWSDKIEFLSALDGRVVNGGVERYKSLNNQHLECLERREIDDESIYLEVQTKHSKIRVAQGARTRVFKKDKQVKPKRKLVQEDGFVGHKFHVKVEEGVPISLEKIVTLYTSKDSGISECGLEASLSLQEAPSFRDLVKTHILSWEHMWRRFEIDYEPLGCHEDDTTALIIHLYTFHLLQTCSLHTMGLDAGVPARGLHGEAYRGHIFWDELFIFPLLNMRIPEITRALLMYRYRRLKWARVIAKQEGHDGAMFPWQSGSDGREETQQVHLNPKSGRWLPDNSHLQRHVNAAICYNIWQYLQTTADMEFMSFYGAEMFFEIARFLASLCTYNEKIDRYEILDVVGPDEYHEGYPEAEEAGLRNNAYTNIMTVWVLTRAIELFSMLSELECCRVCEKIGLGDEERGKWKEICSKMRILFHDGDIISQFEGYDDLEEFDWEGYRKKYGDIQRLDRILEAEGDTPNRYKASKQADVLMLFYLFSAEELGALFGQLGYDFNPSSIPKNIEYYMERTSHGSTLSRVVHAWVLSRSDRTSSWKLFTQALESDVADVQGGTTPEGIHLGAMAGTIDMLQRGYTGLEAREGVLWFNPALPSGLGRLYTTLRYRGHSIEMEITLDRLKIRALVCAAEPVKIGFKTEVVELSTGQTKEFIL